MSEVAMGIFLGVVVPYLMVVIALRPEAAVGADIVARKAAEAERWLDRELSAMRMADAEGRLDDYLLASLQPWRYQTGPMVDFGPGEDRYK